MEENPFNIGQKMDDYQFMQMLKSGALPLKWAKRHNERICDLRFIWQNGAGIRNAYYSIVFGEFFRNPQLKVSSMTIGSGKPYKTESIIVVFDSPIREKNFSIISEVKKVRGGKEQWSSGILNSKALIELLFESAKDVGIEIFPPKHPGEKLIVEANLIPYKKPDENNKHYLYILQIENILKS